MQLYIFPTPGAGICTHCLWHCLNKKKLFKNKKNDYDKWNDNINDISVASNLLPRTQYPLH